jgi:hypothetical protein
MGRAATGGRKGIKERRKERCAGEGEKKGKENEN